MKRFLTINLLALFSLPIYAWGLEIIPPDAKIEGIIPNIYIFGLSLVGISALVMLVIGGVMYMMAGDRDPTAARKMMTNAVLGLVLALVSWLILYTINPDLVSGLKLKLREIRKTPAPATETEEMQQRFGELSRYFRECTSGGNQEACKKFKETPLTREEARELLRHQGE